MGREVIKTLKGNFVAKKRGLLSASSLVADAMDEHNKLDAGQMYERFFGLLALGSTKRRGADTSVRKEDPWVISFDV